MIRTGLQMESRWCLAVTILCVYVAALSGCNVSTSVELGEVEMASNRMFTNPVVEQGADPWVVQWNSAYYYCRSGACNSIEIIRSEQLQEIGSGEMATVWRAPAGTPHSKELWAPELHYLQGKWYIYVAADDGDNHNHRMYVLEGTTQDPQDPFKFKGKICSPDDHWAIDGTVLQMDDGQLYFIWSGWSGDENVAQELYIAPMSDPCTISGERVMISRPTEPWERIGNPWVNEGPAVLRRNGVIHIIYSASGSWTDDYCLGRLTCRDGNVMDPASWDKVGPVFSKVPTAYGPGHCSFTKSPDGTEDWIVYHACEVSGSGWAGRSVRMQPFTWDDSDCPVFGEPVRAREPVALPSAAEFPR